MNYLLARFVYLVTGKLYFREAKMAEPFVFEKIDVLEIHPKGESVTLKIGYLDDTEGWKEEIQTIRPGDRVIVQISGAQICPSCQKLAPDNPATWRKLDPVKVRNSLSRHDNKTYICQLCGGAEAMADYYEIDEARARFIIEAGLDLSELKLKRRE